MSSIKLPSKTSLFAVLTIIAISLFTLYPNFKLALFGDDWLAFVRYLYHLGPNPETSGRWNHLNYFLTPYGAQDILMGLLYKVYGYNSSLYYITSYILRLIAAFSLYPLVFYLTKNSLSAFFSVLFFSVTVTGFDTTNWVFNMPTYISIVFFNFFLLFYIRSNNENNFKLLIPIAITYYFAYIIAPIRMHGVLPFIFILELFWILRQRRFTSIKSSTFRLMTIILVFLFISHTGESSGPPNIFNDRFSEGLTTMREMLNEDRFDFIFYPLVIFGSTILPYTLFDLRLNILDLNSFLRMTSPIFLIFAFILIFLTRYIEPLKKNIKFVLPLILVWWVVVYIVYHFNLSYFSPAIFIILLSIGGAIFITISNLIIFDHKGYISNAFFIALVWTIASYIAPWWFMPNWYESNEMILTSHRYLIVSAVGISILLGTIISLGKDLSKQIAIFTLMLLVLLVHIYSTRVYLNTLLTSHSSEISDKIWSAFPYISEMGEGDKPRLFYFKSDNTNYNIVHDVITFGFPPHTGLIYKYYLHYSPSNNVATSNPQEIISAVTDGQSLKAHGWQKGPIDVNHIYAFQLIGKDSLVNITDQTREELIQIVKNYKSSNP